MSYDGIMTRAVVTELKDLLTGGRIDKVYQHEKDELIIHVYCKGKNHRLLISASSNNPRLYLTNHSKRNPQTPPMFCMLLRKHLSGGVILNISQNGMDRVIIFTISGTDELGMPSEKELVVEIMGKHSNVILIEKETRRIMDSVKRIPAEISRVRQILPGLKYNFIQTEDKSDPLETSKEEFLNIISSTSGNIKLFKFAYQNFIGFSPLLGREICSLTDLDASRTIGSLENAEIERLYNGFCTVRDKINHGEFDPIYIQEKDGTEVIAFYPFPLSQYKGMNQIHSSSVSEMLDYVYKSRDTFDRVNQKSASLKKILHTKLERAQNKLAKQKEELLESQEREKYKVFADLIQSNLHRIEKGADFVVLQNFYDENLTELKVPLDPKISAVENAQRYYKKYGKLKTASRLLLEQIPDTESEISYIEHVLVSLENSDEVEALDEIKDELIHEGYIQRRSMKGKNKKEKTSEPLQFSSSDGFQILVGRNNRQNETLTMKTARKEDLWLHTRGIPGSHVIIRTEGKKVPDSTLKEAAMVAAYFSKGRNSGQVEVDYTEKKYVRKPKNAKTGMVIYENQKTVLAEAKIPDSARAKR